MLAHHLLHRPHILLFDFLIRHPGIPFYFLLDGFDREWHVRPLAVPKHRIVRDTSWSYRGARPQTGYGIAGEKHTPIFLPLPLHDEEGLLVPINLRQLECNFAQYMAVFFPFYL